MKRKSEVEMRRGEVAKTVRSLTRLKHSLAADRELNELLPETLAEFDEAVARGELKAATVRLEDVLGSGLAPLA